MAKSYIYWGDDILVLSFRSAIPYVFGWMQDIVYAENIDLSPSFQEFFIYAELVGSGYNIDIAQFIFTCADAKLFWYLTVKAVKIYLDEISDKEVLQSRQKLINEYMNNLEAKIYQLCNPT
ncbi:hypothetical protein KG892_00910 [Vermiphilus pyriformis]|nr:MAG: hypothetical protein KG892_00910 [Vermiphilus pyriformis]